MLLKAAFETIIIIPNSFIDMARYIFWSGTFLPVNSKEKARALLTKNYHVIEKALSLPNPRVGFGASLIKRTIYLMGLYDDKYGADEVYCHAYNALKSYVLFHERNGMRFQGLEEFLLSKKELVSRLGTTSGGVREVSKEYLVNKSKGNFKSLTEARCSIRNFSEAKIQDTEIEEVIDIVRRTPSVCNRPTTKIYAYSDEQKKKKILALQNGNRGFGSTASHVFIVTADLRSFNGSKERNQSFVDGGLTAMSLVYALQSKGIGTCFLNWSVNSKQDRILKKVAGIPNSSVIATLIVAGHLPEKLIVTQSPKAERESFFALVDV